jgi:quercetin dioxygenase-like cupin family protein
MQAFRSAESAANRGPADWFSGEVWVQPILGPDASPSQRSAVVSFAAGARTAWHTHPRGQMIYVVSGICLAQKDGGELLRVTAGDAVWFAPNEKHWHGAAPDRPMVHLAVQEANEHGEAVVWLEHVKP